MGVKDIVLFDSKKQVGAYSNKIVKYVNINKSVDSLYREIEKLHLEYDRIVIYPTNDLYIENLHEIYDKINSYSFIPFNYENIVDSLDKYTQYSFCEKLGVPYPKTQYITKKEDVDNIILLQLPVLVKPNKREDLKVNVFRNLQIKSREDFEINKDLLYSFIDSGVSFLASEIIPGDGSNIYAYVGYRSKDGNILNEWTGKKLSQHPNDFGVFSSASNQAPEEVLKLGRVLLNGMNISGIAQPEFKYDYRDQKYKLMEINLRSMMWNRVGNISGVNIQYSQYLDAMGIKVPKQLQVKDKDIHFVYLNHEITNVLNRRGYYKIFYQNLFQSDKTCFALYDKKDIVPFIIDCKDIILIIGVLCLKALRIK